MKRKSKSVVADRPSKKLKRDPKDIGSFLDSDDSDSESTNTSETDDQPLKESIDSNPFLNTDTFDDEEDHVEQDEFEMESIDDGSNNPNYPTNGDDDEFLDLGSDDSDDDRLEAMAALEDSKVEQIRRDEEAERREQVMLNEEERAKDFSFTFPSMKELIAEKAAPPNLKVLKDRIESILEVLTSFHTLSDGKHVRKQYLDVLSHAMARYYGYSDDLVKMFLAMFNPNECLAFLEANETSRPLTIRCNTFKCRRRDLAKMLIDRGVNLDPLADWSKEGLKIAKSGNNVPIGATPEYLAGYYMIQSAASLLPVMALDVKGKMKVLDMCAAPGGKTTHICQLMKGNGVVLANDSNAERLKAVYGNVHRMGFKNVVVWHMDGRTLSDRLNPIFDRVLLDAPCSCLGVIARDPSIKYSKKFADVTKMSVLQKELLLTAIDCLKVGGFVVYSTCSISFYENEMVVNHAIQQRYVKVVDTKLPFGEQGFTKMRQHRFHHSLKHTRRYYPHVHNLDGFFVAKLQKVAAGKRGDKKHLADLDREARLDREAELEEQK